jgi:hypothetical protein
MLNNPRQLRNLLYKVGAQSVGAVDDLPFLNGGQAMVQAILEGTSGAASATVLLYGSNDKVCLTSQANAAKETLATFTLSGTGAGLDGTGARADKAFTSIQSPWRYFWAEVTAISGTGARVTLTAGF